MGSVNHRELNDGPLINSGFDISTPPKNSTDGGLRFLTEAPRTDPIVTAPLFPEDPMQADLIGLCQPIIKDIDANYFDKGQLISYDIRDPVTGEPHTHYCVWIDKYVIFEYKYKSNEVDFRPLPESFLDRLKSEGKQSNQAHIKCLDLAKEQYLKNRTKQFKEVTSSTCGCKEMILDLYK